MGQTMTSRERLLAAIRHEEPDHVPLWSQCYGFAPPRSMRWERAGREVAHWYSMRLELDDHTLPEPWGTDDDFERVQRWLRLGVDDILEASPPWSPHPAVRIRDWQAPAGGEERYPLLGRAYETPAGVLEHIVRRTDEQPSPGWVVQPDHVPLFEDFNVGRAVRPAVQGADDLAKLRYLLGEPSPAQLEAYRARMARVQAFAAAQGVLVQGWSAYGMDGIVQLMGAERAVVAAMTEPDFFQELVDMMAAFDRARTEIMLATGGVDMVVQYGWYSGTSFWSPRLFERFVLPHLQELVGLVHQRGALFAYVMTEGVLPMAGLLLAAGIDLLYWVDPVQDAADMVVVKEKFRGRLAVAGGINSAVTLGRGSAQEIQRAVDSAVRTLGPGGGFILSPVDALFPDTPYHAVEVMIGAWREAGRYPLAAG